MERLERPGSVKAAGSALSARLDFTIIQVGLWPEFCLVEPVAALQASMPA